MFETYITIIYLYAFMLFEFVTIVDEFLYRFKNFQLFNEKGLEGNSIWRISEKSHLSHLSPYDRGENYDV